MTSSFTYRRRVNFAETDMVGIVHFSNYFRYLEEAEHAFYRSLDFAGYMPGETITRGWPRVHVSMDYKAPLVYEETFDVHVYVAAKREKSLSHVFLFRKLDGSLIARGKLTVVHVVVDQQTNIMKAAPIPAAIAERLSEADPAEYEVEEFDR